MTETVVASGAAGGMPWRLLLMSTGLQYIGDLLCLEAGPQEQPPSRQCAGSVDFASSGEPLPPVGRPTVTAGEPAFVFGKLEADVAAVVVEVDGDQPVDGQVVGEDRRYYLAALPSGRSPTAVVAYGANGQELGRRSFGSEPERPPTTWQSCGWTEDGRHVCRGGGSGSGSTTKTGGVSSTNEP